MNYADINNNGSIEPASEILEENNYYPFGLKHKGYNELPGAGYKYKFLNKEYESSLGLNVTETDFRQYDSALGRFNVMDALSELAPSYTPYRYGFNNPVYWQDKTGLFESISEVMLYAEQNGIRNYRITRENETGGWLLTIIGGEFDGQQFYDFGNYEILPEMEIQSGGNSSKSNSFWKRLEIGGMFRVWGVMTDIPGFKPNSRKRSAVDVDMNYDEAYQRSAGKSLRWGKDFWKRLKEQLEGMDNRSKLVTPESKSKRIAVAKEKPLSKDEEKIIKIQMKKYTYEKFDKKVVPHVKYYETIYESQKPYYLQMMEQDSLNRLP